MDLIFNVSPYYAGSNIIAHTPYKITVIPKFYNPQLFSKHGIFFEYLFTRYSFHYLFRFCSRIPRWHFPKYVHIVFFQAHSIYLKSLFLAIRLNNSFKYSDTSSFLIQDGRHIVHHCHAKTY